MFDTLKQAARRLKLELNALALACRDPRTPWYAKALIFLIVAYAVSPIDLIPDPIPVVGYLDDLVLLPLGIALVLRMIPREVMAECRVKAQDYTPRAGLLAWIVTASIVLLWIAMVVAAVQVGRSYFSRAG